MMTHVLVFKTSQTRVAVEGYTPCSCFMGDDSFLISINALQVTSQFNRQKALLMFINLVQWVRTVHDQHVLPEHRHALFTNMSRASPYPGESGSPCNVTC